MRDILSKLDNILTESAIAQGISEMDKSQTPPGRDGGDSEAGRKEYTAKPTKADKMMKDAHKVMMKSMSNAEKADKGWRNPNMKEDLEEVFQLGDDFGISFSEDFEIGTEIVGFVEDGIVVELDEHAIELLAAQGLTFLEGELQEGVAGPQSCWKGYRKVGTKPGTGRNAGKRVNDCEKIGEDHAEDPEAPENRAEYDNEGDMAKDDLQTINSAAQELYDILNTDDNLPEWVQSKITKAVDYIDTARDYMKANKEVDEAKYRGREVPLGKKMAGDVKKSKVYVRKPNGNIVKVNFGDKKMRIKKSNPARRRSFRARHNCKNPGPRWKARYWSCRSW